MIVPELLKLRLEFFREHPFPLKGDKQEGILPSKMDQFRYECSEALLVSHGSPYSIRYNLAGDLNRVARASKYRIIRKVSLKEPSTSTACTENTLRCASNIPISSQFSSNVAMVTCASCPEHIPIEPLTEARSAWPSRGRC
jgi:hypothetical protein